MDLLLAKRSETAKLKAEYQRDPTLFAPRAWIEDAALLREFGIVIPGKDALPRGYLKLFPSDFIVEEIAADGALRTIAVPPDVGAQAVPGSAAPEDQAGRAVFATLVKCSLSTLEAVYDLAGKLGCSAQDIHYAGIKDKHAITAQGLSIHGVSIERVRQASDPHYFLKDIRYSKGAVEKGNLAGNRFTIFIRTPAGADMSGFAAAEERVRREGFFNYYWLQRFGTPRLVNYSWGLSILKGQYEEAVRGYLSDTNANELPFFQALRQKIGGLMPDWRAIQGLIADFPLIFANENRIVSRLVEKPGDFAGALQAVDDQAMLWVYGLASLLFNELLSSYAQTAQPAPVLLPLLLSDQPGDIAAYEHLLKAIRYQPPEFKNLKPFPKMRLMHRAAPSMDKVAIEALDISPQGIALRFRLKKGQYATTFLGHLMNAIGGTVPPDISHDKADTAAVLSQGEAGNAAALVRFSEVDASRKDLSFEE